MEDLFEINSSKKIYHANKIKNIFNEQVVGSFPYVVRTTQGNGIRGYIVSNEKYVNDANTLSFAQDTFSVFYQKQKYFTGNKVKVLKSKFENENEKVMQYMTASFQKSLDSFTWGVGSTIETIKETPIKLPTKNGKIDFEFMESFIDELELEKIKNLDVYLLENNLKNYVLTSEEEKVLTDFEAGKFEWEEFKIGDLFEKLNLRFTKNKFDKKNDVSMEKTLEFNLPLVNAKDGSNGIMYYGRSSDFESSKMCIDIVNDGAISTGNVYPQPQKTGVLYNAYLVRPIFTATRDLLHFFASTMQKSIKLKFGYENKAGWVKVKEEKIQLPTKNSQPDYEKMEVLISAVQKMVVKDLVIYVAKKLK